ncbi:hypothetical protein ACFQ61_31880 [Streptomyces sp. NPDC056500]|uniref:hypothetical protein n=1 Tax=Streptomyces sp. NPDC056500 TaxID=3345840 RepID=UPI0036B49BEF
MRIPYLAWAAVERCLAHREDQRTDNPHVMVVRQTKSGQSPASTAYVSHILDACGFLPRMIRGTRLLALVNTMDPKLVAATLDMDPEATMPYVADRVCPGHRPMPNRGDKFAGHGSVQSAESAKCRASCVTTADTPSPDRSPR